MDYFVSCQYVGLYSLDGTMGGQWWNVKYLGVSGRGLIEIQYYIGVSGIIEQEHTKCSQVKDV